MRLSFRRRVLGLCTCGLLPVLYPQIVAAARWSADPSIDATATYDDNIAFTPGPHRSVWGLALSPGVLFSGETETLKVNGGLQVALRRYFGEDGLDTNDYYFKSASSYRAERHLLTLNLAASRDPTLVTELATTGVVLARQPRRQTTANPSWTYSLNELTTTSVAYNHTDVNYAGTSRTGLIDYRQQNIASGVRRLLNERSALSVTVYYDRYETRPKVFVASSYGVSTGLDYSFSETLRGRIDGGFRNTRSRLSSRAIVCEGTVLSGVCFGELSSVSSESSRSSSGYTVNASLEKQWETAILDGRLVRELNPSGAGALVQTDRAQVHYAYRWSSVLSAEITGAAYQTRYVGGLVVGSDSRYYRLDPRLSWRPRDRWTLTAGYAYSSVRYQHTSTSATENAAYVTVSYAWPQLSASR